MRFRRLSVITALVVLAALLLAPAALAGGAAGSAGVILDWTTTRFAADDGAAHDNYGQSVAIDGDTAVVGAPCKTVGANTAQGAVYVYTRAGGRWTLETAIVADDGAAGDHFGYAVSLDDDTIAIGAPHAGAGAVYVYTRAGEGWSQVAKLTSGVTYAPAGPTVGEWWVCYGFSVSLRGSVLAVGAPGAGEQGVAYVYRWVPGSGSWDLWATLEPDDQAGSGSAVGGASSRLFGDAVSLNADDDLELVVGAPGYQDRDGAVYLYDTQSDVWTLNQTLTQPEAAGAVGSFYGDEFGDAVSLRGDVLAVGSSISVIPPAGADDAVGSSYSGAAYVYHRRDGEFSTVARLAPANPGGTDTFGASVALAGDLTVLVGAPYRDVDDDVRRGSVFAYDWTGQIYQDPYQLIESSGGADDWLGTSVAVSDGQVLAGAPGTTVGANVSQGAAWLFTLPRPVARVKGHKVAWQDAAVRLCFSGTAAAGGAVVDSAQYRVGTGNWKTGASLKVWRQGVTRVQYRVVDLFGTLSPVRTCRVRIDTRRPTVVARAAAAGAGTIARLAYKVADPRPSSGTARVRLVVENAAGAVVTRSTTLPVRTNAWHTVRIKALRLSPGTYTVLLHAVDRAGNAQKDWTAATLTVK